MADIRVICAIGQSGQLGLHGELPWEGNPGRPFV
ncbi:MAG: diacylglycerol kinase, partial [Rhizobiaceae bacterium]|nr:diacylglycerol kinase [Rhizobiaceae bacterium]